MLALLDTGQFDWNHFFEMFFGAIGALTTVGGLAWAIYSYYAKDREERAEAERRALLDAAKLAEEKNNIRHAENQAALKGLSDNMGKMNLVLRFLRLHRHKETAGVLQAENIDYGPDEW